MDVVVTVPKRLWQEWLGEGNLPRPNVGMLPTPWDGEQDYGFNLSTTFRPQIEPGERVYIVAFGQLRGWAPLVRFADAEEAIRRFGADPSKGDRNYSLLRRGGAVACTLRDPIKGFQGYRYRWWDRKNELLFPTWQTEGVT